MAPVERAQHAEHASSFGAAAGESPPRVSVIVPYYKKADFIADTLESVFAQTYSDYEVIVVNDGSPDAAEFATAIGRYLDRITLLDCRRNLGTGAARNVGIRCARGELIAFLDSDDVWLPEYLREQVKFLDGHHFDMVYSAGIFFGETPHAGADTRASNPPCGQITRKQLIDGNCHILPSGTLVTKLSLERVGLFDERPGFWEDFDLFVRLMFAGMNIAYQHRLLFRYRVWAGGRTADELRSFQRNIEVWRYLQQKLPFTSDECARIERHVQAEESAVLRTKGKIAISDGNWNEAAEHLKEAKALAKSLGFSFKHRLKLAGALILLRWAPLLLRQFMKRAKRLGKLRAALWSYSQSR